MIGRAALGRIDNELRQILPAFSESPFGGLSVMLVGDFGQLVSRVKSLRGLAFRPGLSLQRILEKVPGNPGSRSAARDDEKRREKLGFLD